MAGPKPKKTPDKTSDKTSDKKPKWKTIAVVVAIVVALALIVVGVVLVVGRSPSSLSTGSTSAPSSKTVRVVLYSSTGQTATISWTDNKDGGLSDIWALDGFTPTERCVSPTYVGGVESLICGQLDSSTDRLLQLDDVSSYTISDPSYTLLQLLNVGAPNGHCAAINGRVTNNDVVGFGNGTYCFNDYFADPVCNTFMQNQSSTSRFAIHRAGAARCGI